MKKNGTDKRIIFASTQRNLKVISTSNCIDLYCTYW